MGGVGHHPDRLRQHLRVLHRPCGAGQGDQPALRRRRRRGRTAAADGVTEVTLLGQNVNSYGRDLALAARQAGPPSGFGRCSTGSCARSAPSTASAGPLHQPPPQGPAARDHRGDGRDPGGVRAPAPAAAVGQRPGAGGHAPRLHRRALPGAPGRGPGRGRRPGRHHRHHRRVPGETDDDFERTLEVVAEAAYDSAYTFIYSPRPGTEAAERVDDFVAAEVVAERFERLRVVVERSRWPGTRPASAASRRSLVEGPAQGPVGPHRPDPPEQARALPVRRRSAAGTYADRPRSPAPRPTTCGASWSRWSGRPPTAPGCPCSSVDLDHRGALRRTPRRRARGRRCMAELNERYADADHLDHADLRRRGRRGRRGLPGRGHRRADHPPASAPFLVALARRRASSAAAPSSRSTRTRPGAEIKRMYTAPLGPWERRGPAPSSSALEAVAAELGYRRRPARDRDGPARGHGALRRRTAGTGSSPTGTTGESPLSVCFAKALDPP